MRLQLLADELNVHVRRLRAAAHDGRLAATFGPRHRSARPIRHNATIESFNGRFMEECLHVRWFASLDDAQQKIDAFRWDRQ
jgi:putative transposase